MIIPNLGKLLLEQAKIAHQKKEMKDWFKDRNYAMDFYNGNTEKYTEKYLKQANTPTAVVNITKRIIDRVSLVYMVPPIRVIDDDSYDYKETHKDIDERMQRAEKLTNLLDALLIVRVWRDGKIATDIIWEYELIFSTQDTKKVIGFTYPLASRSQPNNDKEVWVYWDSDNHYKYERSTLLGVSTNTRIIKDPENPEMINPYGVLPGIITFREGIPERYFLDVDYARDVVKTNLAMNVVETAKYGNLIFQSFGHEYVAGDNIDLSKQDIGPDKRTFLPQGATMGIVNPPDTVTSIEGALDGMTRRLSLNWHLPSDFFEGSQAESGIHLRLRNQELTDDRKTDITRWRGYEHQLFDIDNKIIEVQTGKPLGKDFSVDFSETEMMLTPQEQREQDEWDMSHKIKDVVDVLMERDPDKYPDRKDAIEYLEQRGWKDPSKQTVGSALVEALNG